MYGIIRLIRFYKMRNYSFNSDISICSVCLCTISCFYFLRGRRAGGVGEGAERISQI